MVGMGGIGSNNWVVNGSYTQSGKPMLANDPHLGFNMPSVWYVNGLHCAQVSPACPWDVVGVTFPGTPGVIAGHNERISWGVTNVNPDVQDLVMEKVDPADPTKYVTAAGSQPFTVRTEYIKVAGGSTVTLNVRETAHGPIINDADSRLKGTAQLLALRWTAIALPDRIIEAFLNIDTAANWNDFRGALRLFGAPSQNFVYADVDGNIGYQMPGAIPVRTLPSDQGLRPVPGWDGQHEWVSFIPFDQLPSVYNPPSGRIVTANNPVDGGANFIGAEYDRGDRAARITQLLDAAKRTVTTATMTSIQGDTTLLRGLRMQAALKAMGPKPLTADGQAVLDAVLGWDGTCPVASTGCSAFSVFEMSVERAIFDDDLGPYAANYTGTDWANDLAATLIGTPDGQTSAWWGNRKAGTGADASKITATALDSAGALLRRDAGEPKDWVWGKIHTIVFKELTYGDSGIGPLEWYFDTGTYPVAGANGAPDNTSYGFGGAYPDPVDGSPATATTLSQIFNVTLGPSMRAIYDMGSLDSSRIVTTTGQSGVPFSAHNQDFVPKWLANETVPLPFTADAVAKATSSSLVLQPAP
jgi:penicillin G amidase